ncbi:MAG: VOC family protein [Fimbriimonas ginsengisoli]|nr:VOC family protein [Fimbriimonas ginsengisoli]
MPSVLSNLILDVKDLDRSLAFYHGMLKLPISRRDTWQGHRLAYLGSGGSAEILLLQQPMEDQPTQRSVGLVLKFYVQNLPGMADDLSQKKVPVLQGLDMAPAGERTLLVQDPDGYAVLLSEPVETLN